MASKSIYKKIGENIKETRKKRGLSQEKLAELTNMDTKSIVMIESGKRNPTIKSINKIAKVLKISLSKFFESI